MSADPLAKKTRRRIDSWKIKTALVLFSSAVAFSCIELGARIWVYQNYRKNVARYEHEPYLIEAGTPLQFRLKPHLSQNVDIGTNTWTYVTNSRGFRGGEIDPIKPPGVRRVVFLGDSFTFGYAVTEDESLPSQFEAKWNSRENAPYEIQSVNLGVPGYNTIQELACLREQFDVWKPDAIVLLYVLNDAEPQISVPPHPKDEFRNINWWYIEELKRVLNDLFFERDPYFESGRYTGETSNIAPGFAPGNEKGLGSKKALGEIAAFCRERDVPLLFAIAPHVVLPLTDEYPYTEIHQQVMGWANEFEMNAIDLLPTVRGRNHEELSVPRDGHPNGACHAIFAEAILPELKRLME